ncbi:MAG: RluA family pseudouridine synthase [Deltaproteobacteria bacterium]|nr:RluA family pseudouridine synthase [Deltaproteobacteria bacterium]HCH65682.1 RluA family pseudouridine synthase [Deltaproteobacteria bacterium]
MSDPRVHRTEATKAGRLDAVLAHQVPLSRSRLKALIQEGRITVNGELERSPRRKVWAGDVLVVHEPPPPPSGLRAQDLDVPLLHIDDSCVVVDKPADMVVHPAKGHPDGTLVNGLLHLITEARHEEGPYPTPPGRPGIVHRLDRGTSGVLVVARTPAALTHLAAQFAAHTVDRAYAALVWGATPGPSGTIDAPLARHPADRMRYSVQERGKRAVTHWSRIAEARYGVAGDARGGALSLVQCRLETGRTHQIRVHMHSIGLPLVGDPLYGRRKPIPSSLREALGPIDRQLLHAGRLGFEHPVQAERLKFLRPPAADFRRVLLELKLPVPFLV